MQQSNSEQSKLEHNKSEQNHMQHSNSDRLYSEQNYPLRHEKVSELRAYPDQWMIDNIPDQDLVGYEQLKDLFFDQLTEHKYIKQRLVWLQRWIDPSNENLDIERSIQERTSSGKRLEFLTKIWSKSYFHPFLTTSQADQIIAMQRDSYLIALSSTIPGNIRVTFWNDGVKHHRIQLDHNPIDYQVDKLEEEIIEYISKHKSPEVHRNKTSFVKYVNVNDRIFKEEDYKSETNS